MGYQKDKWGLIAMRNAKGMQLTSKFVNRRLAIKEKKGYFVRANENKHFLLNTNGFLIISFECHLKAGLPHSKELWWSNYSGTLFPKPQRGLAEIILLRHYCHPDWLTPLDPQGIITTFYTKWAFWHHRQPISRTSVWAFKYCGSAG